MPGKKCCEKIETLILSKIIVDGNLVRHYSRIKPSTVNQRESVQFSKVTDIAKEDHREMRRIRQMAAALFSRMSN